MPQTNLTALRHTMANSDTLASDFCSALALGDLYDGLVNCGSVPATSLELGEGGYLELGEGGYLELGNGD